MKVIFLLLTLSGLIYSSGLGNLELGGYIENKTSLTIAEEESFTAIATLRLEGSWKFGKMGGVETNVIISAALNQFDMSTIYKKSSVMERVFYDLISTPFSMALLSYTSNPENLILDRALLKLYFKWCDFYIGRQMIAWGTGYAFNPTDIWNIKNPIDAEAPKTGVNALRMEIPFGSVSGLSIVFSPGKNFDNSSAGFRLKGNIGGYDLSMCGMSIINEEKAFLGIHRKLMAGADLAGQIGDVGIWTEGAAINPIINHGEFNNFDSIYAQIDAGLDYTFKNGLYVMVEYYYNGLGQVSYKKYSSSDFFNIVGGEMAGFAQNYIMGGFRKDLFDKFMLTVFGLGNLNDYSVLILPSVEYDFNDNISMNLSGRIGAGKKERSEYGSLNSSVTVTFTGYF